MDTTTALSLIENTFKHNFNMENFEYFITELFDESNFKAKHAKKPDKEFEDYYNNFYSLGSFTDKFQNTIGVYAVELAKESYRDRARTMQRNLIAKNMNKNFDAAIVAFYESSSDDWRFSFVNVGYEINENGIEEKLSSPKRHSFLVGPNEPNHTCQKQFLNLLISEEKITLDDIKEAFNIENVTDEFFLEYKRLFLDLNDSLESIKQSDFVVKEEFDGKNIQSSDFAKKLMGQLVFIYFLQKKGWLGVKQSADWGTGPKNFLRLIFEKSKKENKNFFNDVLEPMFYEGLSEEVRDDHYSKFGYRVPFLNGGLFEPINNYDWVKTNVVLDNSIFSEILDTFDKFNFTVKEDEPLEKEVAVDPEMLGKVFENLLEVTDRKSKGAFYTPRNIVHYMCQENLISYLNTNSGLSEEDLRIFITKGDLAVNSIIRANEEKRKYNGKQFTIIELPESIKENSDELESLLKKVKVIDPAVGSGAFPVGMMNEIVKARYILRLLHDIDNINMYELKRETIENSLYGVDLELSATDVTKLRFWLSLIVDEDDLKQIRPLPNLDNQIMCGNSVIDGYDNVKLFDDSLIVRSSQTKLSMTPHERAFEELERKKREYFDVSGPHRKEELKKEINQLKWEFLESYLKDIGRQDLIDEVKKYEFSESKPYFIWELEFSEIFKGENPGFDIVIGNPPYVRQEKIKEIKPYLKEHYKTYTGVADLYVYFFEKGLKILKEKGIFAFICSNKFAKAKYGEKLRKLILENQLKIYDDFTGVKIFKEAQVDTCVIQIKKNLDQENKIYVNNKYYMEQKRLDYKSFAFYSPEILNLRDKITNQGIIIKNLDITINYGIKTGFNEAFIIDEITKNQLIQEDSNNKEIIKPLLRGRDIDKWKISYKNLYLIHSFDGLNTKEKYPSVYNFLKQYKEKLEKRHDKGKYWYNLRPCSYDDLFEKEKLIYPNMSSGLFPVYDNQKFFTNQKCFILTSDSIDIKYLNGLLASNVLNFIFSLIGANLGSKGYDLNKIFIEKLPIKLSNKNEELMIINVVNTILNLNKNITKLEEKFFKLLFNEYNLSNLSKKLEKFYYLSEKEFKKEIKKKIKNYDEINLLKEYNLIKNEIIILNAEIEKNNNHLNDIIYELYNLNKSEIKLLEDLIQ